MFFSACYPCCLCLQLKVKVLSCLLPLLLGVNVLSCSLPLLLVFAWGKSSTLPVTPAVSIKIDEMWRKLRLRPQCIFWQLIYLILDVAEILLEMKSNRENNLHSSANSSKQYYWAGAGFFFVGARESNIPYVDSFRTLKVDLTSAEATGKD